ncbi:MAG: DUF5313 family protein [Gordonia sp. (in: high G+C Gram-positive bacteria)]|uniref:DUF5313 family protein n=1 Tax=Gordonia TaxID=2053 RepID=UPI0032675A6F
MSAQRPGFGQKIGYLLGRSLPASMQDWVIEDLTGPGHLRRYLIRGIVPILPLFLIFAFIPGGIWVKLGMIVLLLIPFVYFQLALGHIYRRHLMVNNGLDPALLETAKVVRADAVRNEYRDRYGK